jgi:hypothetical protein
VELNTLVSAPEFGVLVPFRDVVEAPGAGCDTSRARSLSSSQVVGISVPCLLHRHTVVIHILGLGIRRLR